MIALMGGSPEQVPDRYAAADALTGDTTDVPITVLHGADDEVIPVEMSRAVTGVEYRELWGIGHFDIIDPRTSSYPAVLAAVRGDSQSRRRRGPRGARQDRFGVFGSGFGNRPPPVVQNVPLPGSDGTGAG